MSTTLCAEISADILVNCTNPIQGGTRDNLYLFNFEEFKDAAITRNMTNAQIIEAIALASGNVGYTIQGLNNSNAPKHSFVKGKFLGSFSHEINFKTFKLNPTVKEQLEKMCKGRFVAIVENNYRGDAGEAAFEIYGLDSGLVMESLERDPANADTQGAYDITLKSSDLSREAHLPATIFLTDYTTSKAIVESLL